MTTEIQLNLHQSIQPIGNNYIFAKKGNILCSDRVVLLYSYTTSLTFDSQQVQHRTKCIMTLATSSVFLRTHQRATSAQRRVYGPYRLSPLHHSPYKTVDSSLREAKTICVGCPTPWHSVRCLLPFRLLARLITRLLPFPRYPSISHPLRRCMCATRSPPRHSRPFHTIPAAAATAATH